MIQTIRFDSLVPPWMAGGNLSAPAPSVSADRRSEAVKANTAQADRSTLLSAFSLQGRATALGALAAQAAAINPFAYGPVQRPSNGLATISPAAYQGLGRRMTALFGASPSYARLSVGALQSVLLSGSGLAGLQVDTVG